MGKKRKRPVKNDPIRREKPSPSQPAGNTRHPSRTNGNHAADAAYIYHPVISLYYRQVVTLRQYILQRIPRSSKARRRRIAAVGGVNAARAGPTAAPKSEKYLADLLDTTLVGILKELPPAQCEERRREFIAFTQAQLKTQAGTDTGPRSLQTEIVDYAISSIFNRPLYGKLEHVLSHGYRQGGGRLPCSIPNVAAQYPNKNVEMLKQSPWTEVLALLGGSGDEIMLKLLLDCGLFMAVDTKKGIYCQISGLALSSLKPIHTSTENCPVATSGSISSAKHHALSGQAAEARAHTKGSKENQYQLSPNAVVFCRQRMLYARPHLNSNGRITFGLPNHVLSRFPSSHTLQQTVHVMKYVFPRQFGLHNVFTTQSSYRENPLSKNYSSREEEIARKEGLGQARYQLRGSGFSAAAGKPQESIKIPKRLRGKPLELIRQLQNRSKRCCYKKLLQYYCSEELPSPRILGPLSVDSMGVPSSPGSRPLISQRSVTHRGVQRVLRPTSYTEGLGKGPGATRPRVSLTDHATPTASVSAFCRAVIRSLIPLEFFGVGEQGAAHQKIILGHVDRFIRMRRYESLSLHEVCEGIKIAQIPWLKPESLRQASSKNKISASDLHKRRELFHEFLYYLFDSILLPLIRGHFYVTESQIHRHRLFYFRHDVWRSLTAQPLAHLRASMLEELVPETAEKLLSAQKSLGYGSLRLLPKTTGIRPIVNLKRRTLVRSTYAGKNRYNPAQSVNSVITPVYSMLNYERGRRNDLLGSSMFSVGDMHSRLKGFKESLTGRGWNQRKRLYFVKLDIQSCFDTIPQAKIVRLVEKLVSEENYHWMKYVEMRLASEFDNMWPLREPDQRRTWSKYLQRVGPVGKPEHLADAITNGSVVGRRNTVFVDTIAQREYSGEGLLDILNEHIRNNLVKIGKKYFRQRNGIPQGSVLSSLLCSLLYAEMERNVLNVLKKDDALLLRLLDDFLLITLDSGLAMDFLQVMVRGQPEYGISVNPAKSLVNFAASVDGAQIPRLIDTSLFPYCGSLIDTRTLEIFKDQDRLLEGGESARVSLSDSLSIDSMRTPGRSFHRKVLASVKQSMHPMYLDSSHNSLPVVLLNIYKALTTAAMKMYRYTRSLPGRARPRPEVVVRTIHDALQLGYRLIRSRHGLCRVTHLQLQYLGAAAFQFVLGRKQTQYASVLRWLDGTMAKARQSVGNGALLAQAVQRGNRTYKEWRF